MTAVFMPSSATSHNAADPVCTATDLNSHSGRRVLGEAASSAVELATSRPMGPTAAASTTGRQITWPDTHGGSSTRRSGRRDHRPSHQKGYRYDRSRVLHLTTRRQGSHRRRSLAGRSDRWPTPPRPGPRSRQPRTGLSSIILASMASTSMSGPRCRGRRFSGEGVDAGSHWPTRRRWRRGNHPPRL